jgi:hypothetical protein
MNSRKLNLNLDLPIDIKFDANIKTLLQYWENFLLKFQ